MVAEIKQFTIAERLERLPLTNYQRKIFLIVATAWFFDCVDIASMTFALSSIKSDFQLSSAQTGLLGSMSFFGMFIGAMTAGILADRFGRRTVLQWSMIVWGIASLLCAFVPNIQTLMICRIILGIGLAMELPVAQSLICEMVPARSRGRYAAALEGFAPIGFFAAGCLAYLVLPAYGWRALFIMQSIPALFVFAVRRYLPESPRWLHGSGKSVEALKVLDKIENDVLKASGQTNLPIPNQLKALTSSSRGIEQFRLQDIFRSNLQKKTTMLWLVWFFTLLGFYGINTWLGALLRAKGFGLTESIGYLILISTGGLPGFIAISWLVESWGRKPTCIFVTLSCAVAAYLYGTASTPLQIILLGILMQFFMYGMRSAVYAYTPELYPTAGRATGSGIANSIGRLGALLGSYAIGIILPISGQSGVFALAGSAFVAAAITVAILGEETKGKVLEHIV